MTVEVPGFPGYRVTDEGEVLGKRGTPLRPRAHWRTGHLRVRLYGSHLAPVTVERGGRVQVCRFVDVYVHKLVCLAFHGPPPDPEAFVLHYDDDPTHNCPGNLRWGSRFDNASDAARNSVDDDGFDWATGEQREAA